MVKINRSNLTEKTAFFIVRGGAFLVIGVLLFILGYIFIKGASAISWEFITEMPRKEMTEGGIFPAIIGTFYLMLGLSLIHI